MTELGFYSLSERHLDLLHFNPDYSRFYAANEDSDTIVEMKLDSVIGQMEYTGRIIDRKSGLHYIQIGGRCMNLGVVLLILLFVGNRYRIRQKIVMPVFSVLHLQCFFELFLKWMRKKSFPGFSVRLCLFRWLVLFICLQLLMEMEHWNCWQERW